MSSPLISRSGDLLRLQEDGYEVSVLAGHLLIGHVPYVADDRTVKYGTLVSTLTLAGDVTARPDTHVVMFAGEMPCDQAGQPLNTILAGSAHQRVADGLEIDHTFSSKPPQGYPDYQAKMTAYVAILAGPAQAFDSDATAQTFPLVENTDSESVFKYMETASGRAGITAVTEKLKVDKVAIVGLGGTGSYVLDFVAKTPVREIHLFDGDLFLQHNAFRAPGAPTLDQLRATPAKVAYFAERYSQMRSGIIPHPQLLDASNIDQLQPMDFVFLTLDDGPTRQLAVEKLSSWGTCFVDAGMGIYESGGCLGGLVRTTASTPEKREHLSTRLPFGAADPDDEYRQNIQIAELNALNAAQAVIKWKKLVGFYSDLEHEHHSTYEIDGNTVLNEDHG